MRATLLKEKPCPYSQFVRGDPGVRQSLLSDSLRSPKRVGPVCVLHTCSTARPTNEISLVRLTVSEHTIMPALGLLELKLSTCLYHTNHWLLILTEEQALCPLGKPYCLIERNYRNFWEMLANVPLRSLDRYPLNALPEPYTDTVHVVVPIIYEHWHLSPLAIQPE